MGRGLQAEVWAGSCGLRDAKADAEGFVRMVQERYTNAGGGDLGEGLKGVKGFGGSGVKEVCVYLDKKRDPRGIAPRV